MTTLFDHYQIRDMLIRNRFMRSATTSAYADIDGIINDMIIKHYELMSKGEVGLIVKGHLYVLDSGKAHNGMAGISHDKHIKMLKKLTDSVHKHQGRIVAQLNHAGVVHQQDRAGPSPYSEDDWSARELSEDEILTITEGFGEAAERAMQAGFDGVQIHGAHGYLVSQFLSRRVNKRTDKWGGSLENRMRFLHEIYDEIRGRLGNEPVLIKLNCDDFSTDGFVIEDSIKVTRTMAEKGIDLIEISGGGRGARADLRIRSKHPEFPELDFAGHAIRIRKEIKPTPMALVGGFKTLNTMRRAVERDLTDMISLSRPFIREPDLIKKLKNGQTESTCIRCDACRANFGLKMIQCLLE